MARLTALKGLLICALASLALAVAPGHVNYHEARAAAPAGFTSRRAAAPEQVLKLRMALAQTDADGVVDALYRVSDPKSPSYGKHLSKAEASSSPLQTVEKLVAPKPDSLAAVHSWLSANDLSGASISPAGDWIEFAIPVGKANELLNADFRVYAQEETGAESIRTLAYSVPDALKGHVDLFHPTVSFPQPVAFSKPTKEKRAFHHVVKREGVSSCTDGTTPHCLQDLYDIPLTPAVNKDNRLAVTGFTGNSAHFTDLEIFLQKYRPDMDPKTSFEVDGIDGGTNPQEGPSVSEGELDIQYTVGLATGVPVTYIFVGINNTDGGLNGYLDELNHLLAQDSPPQVLTTSYGHTEDSVSFALTDKLCKAYAQLGARGVSILFASGDSGVGCSRNDPNLFEPTFPSNCPFVTSVGGTQDSGPEVGWVASGGGFSTYYPRPAYQDAAVSAWLAAHGSENAGRYNASGRAFPDIAARADFFRIEANGPSGLTGTSASSPTWASIVALVNDRLASAGRPPLGFLNPWLYSDGVQALTDITKGEYVIQCSVDAPAQGWNATEGWDPVTGLGTPKFGEILQVLKLLQ